MISLRKTMEMQAEDLVRSTLDAYLAALAAMGDAGARACPSSGIQLQQNLLNLSGRLSAERSPGAVVEAEANLEKELDVWSSQASRYFQDKTDEVKEILNILAVAAQEVSERDERHSKRFRQLTDRLSATAKLNDLTAMKHSLHHGVEDLRNSVAKMAQDSQESVTQLRAKLTTYQTRLLEVERIAFLDPLTGVANRRMVERQFDLRAAAGRPFSLVYVDLNGFKRINDQYGHHAGDVLLQQYATELRGAFRGTDLVGRLGGDEFVALMDGGAPEADSGLDRIAKWVNGEYTVNGDQAVQKIMVSGTAGAAQWRPGLTLADLLKLADSAMYGNKPHARAR
ncbi:MAG TPA: GGDEF domain-containing protein [Bryobacteraceae bacterium]|jgi:diguanylate cyclase (GGDEF)-like protein